MNRKRALKNLAGLAVLGSSIDLKAKSRKLTATTGISRIERDWLAVRELFNIDRNKSYLNNGTIGPNPKPVLKAIIDALEERSRTVEYSGASKTRSSFASLINCDPKEIVLTENTTHGNNIIIQGLRLKRNDEIITSTHEHVGNAMPILNRARRSSLALKVFKPAKSKKQVLEQIDNLVTSRTKAICLPHISCTTGQLFPIEEIADIIGQRDIFLAVDGAHGPGSRKVDVQALNCDSYTTSCHKWLLGAYGTGFTYIKSDRLDQLDVGYIGHSAATKWTLEPEEASFVEKTDSATRFMYGTKSAPQFLGSQAAVDFHDHFGAEIIEGRIAELQEYLFNGLMERGDLLELVSPMNQADRGPMQTFVPKRTDYKAFWKTCVNSNVRLRQLPEAGINGIRVSTHIYNNTEDLDRLFELIDANL